MKLLLTYLAALSAAFGDCRHHNAVFKSIRGADHECSIYLREGTCHSADCSLRCRGLLTRFWNDTVGVPSATVNRFYQPSANDYEYYERTECCLAGVKEKVPLEDVCRRAEASTECYHRNYGQLQADTPKFVPFTDLQHQQILQDCIDIHQIPESVLVGYVKHGIKLYPEAKCLLRCFLIREGHYTDAGGPDLHRMSVQCEGNYSDEKFRKKASKCIRNLQEQCIDKCELAFRISDECVNGEIALLSVFLGASNTTSNSVTVSPSSTLVLPPKVNVNGPSVFPPRPALG